jgi:hypothetical protein
MTSLLFNIKISSYQLDYFFRFRKSPFLEFRKNKTAVKENVKTMKFSRFQLDFNIELFLYLFRQPGGSCFIRSRSTVLYYDTHTPLFSR